MNIHLLMMRLFSIGNPLGYDWTISEEALLSVRSPLINAPLIYFSGPVQPGSSGSSFLMINLRLSGVIFAEALTNQDNAGLAIPISYLTNFLEEKSTEHLRHCLYPARGLNK